MDDANKESADFEAGYANTGDAPAEPDHIYKFDDAGLNELAKYCVWLEWRARAAKAPAAEPVAEIKEMFIPATGASTKAAYLMDTSLPGGSMLYTAPPSPKEQWMPIETAPESESVSILLLVPGNDVSDYLVVQVSKFEGNYYPDVMDCNVDWHSRVTKATHWMPLPAPPQGAAKGATDAASS